MTRPPASTQLGALTERLDALTAAFGDLATDLGPHGFRRRPEPKSWSVAEILAHLALTNAVYLRDLEPALERLAARDERTQAPYRPRRTGRLFAWLLAPPPRLRVPAPRPFDLRGAEPSARVLEELSDSNRKLVELLARGDGLPLDRAAIPSPAARWIRFDLYSAFLVLVTHEERHLWQARRVAERVARLPASSVPA